MSELNDIVCSKIKLEYNNLEYFRRAILRTKSMIGLLGPYLQAYMIDLFNESWTEGTFSEECTKVAIL